MTQFEDVEWRILCPDEFDFAFQQWTDGGRAESLIRCAPIVHIVCVLLRLPLETFSELEQNFVLKFRRLIDTLHVAFVWRTFEQVAGDGREVRRFGEGNSRVFHFN